jgi:hypothetical protein
VRSGNHASPATTHQDRNHHRRSVPQANRIGEQLRMLYADVFAEPIPPQWTELVKRLEARRNDSKESK